LLFCLLKLLTEFDVRISELSHAIEDHLRNSLVAIRANRANIGRPFRAQTIVANVVKLQLPRSVIAAKAKVLELVASEDAPPKIGVYVLGKRGVT
jgi:hypothetical protein